MARSLVAPVSIHEACADRDGRPEGKAQLSGRLELGQQRSGANCTSVRPVVAAVSAAANDRTQRTPLPLQKTAVIAIGKPPVLDPAKGLLGFLAASRNSLRFSHVNGPESFIDSPTILFGVSHR